MSMYTCSRTEKYFPEAEKFNPNRWTRPTEGHQYSLVTDPYATLPYSFGSRACIGKKLAQAQLVMSIGKVSMQMKILIFYQLLSKMEKIEKFIEKSTILPRAI